jgi:hypothetical protein
METFLGLTPINKVIVIEGVTLIESEKEVEVLLARNGYEVAEMPQLHIIPLRYSADLFSLGPRERGEAGMAASENSAFQISDKEPGSRDPTSDRTSGAREKTNARYDPEDARHGLGG